MRALPLTAIISILACGLGSSGEDAPAFAKKPAVSKAGEGLKIEFAAAAPTDCAVYILDAKDKVVRHLAAGVLGKNAPEPLQKNSLVQSIAWDGKDDCGKQVYGGPLAAAKPPGEAGFKIRVGLGLKPVLDRFIGVDPGAMAEGMVRAIATGPNGEVFVFHCFGNIHPGDYSVTCVVLDRKGNYLRTILPWPANLPEDKLKGLKRLDLGGGVKVPFYCQVETRSLVPGAGYLGAQRPVVTKEGRLIFAGIQEFGRYPGAGLVQLVGLGTDGSAPEDLLGPVIVERGGAGAQRAASLALSPDGRTIYAADTATGVDPGKQVPQHAVYKFAWADKKAEVFLGSEKESGGDEQHFNDPRGLAVDQEGNLYVADKNNDRVAVFKPDGSFLGALKTAKPVRVEVHSRTGAVYVLGGTDGTELQKFASWKETAPVARVKVPAYKGYEAVMALDGSAEPPILWLGATISYSHYTLLRVEDQGKAFGAPEDVRKASSKDPVVMSMSWLKNLTVDRQHEEVWINRGPRFDGRTGKVENVSIQIPKDSYGEGAIVSAGLDGHIYLHSAGAKMGVYRFDRDAKPANFPGTDTNHIRNPGSLRVHARGLTADPKGNVYLLWEVIPPEYLKNDDKMFLMNPQNTRQTDCLALYGPDGTLKNLKLVDADIRNLNSVRVDYAGNVYLAVGLRPGKDLLPAGLKGQVPESAKDPLAVRGINGYPLIYGSIVKFGPEGGAIRKGAGGVAGNFLYGLPIEVKDAQWIHSGASPVTTGDMNLTNSFCQCESPSIDVDGFGRSFFPDALRFRVGVLDTNGNEVCTFGAYGNADSAGPKGGSTSSPPDALSQSKGAVPVPEIPLLWPYAVGVSDEAAYVGDRLNRRVARVKIAYAAEETCAVQ